MAKKNLKVKKTKKRKDGKNQDKKKILMIVGVVFFVLVLAELAFFGIPKDDGVFKVQQVGQFTGIDQACGPFHAWDVVRVGGDKIALSDQPNKRILIFDLKGQFLKAITEKDAGAPPFNEISNMSFDVQGNFYVMDCWNSLIRGFDKDGKPILQVAVTNTFGPRGVAWTKGDFLLADTGLHKIMKLTASGNLLSSWGHRGSEKGAFGDPAAIAVDPQGNFYVADADNHRVQAFDPQGKFLKKFEVGSVVENVALDSQGRVFASTSEGDFVKVFDKEGKSIGKLTKVGQNEPLHGLKGLTMTDDGNIVASAGDKVFIFHPVP